MPKKHNFSVVFDNCLAVRHGQCVINLNRKAVSEISWVACDSCGSWYHSVCLGLSASFCKERRVYCMCQTLPSDMDELQSAQYNLS